MKETSNRLSNSGAFIVFEGGEGTGKSTQIKSTQKFLEAQGFEVLVTFEPGGTPLGEKIRALLLDTSNTGMSSRAETLLYSAARAEHVEKVIKPAIQRGAMVLCDRYWDASRAYQGVGRKLGIAAIDQINSWATQGLVPHKVFIFDLPAKIGLQRAHVRGEGKLDRVESESLDFHESVRLAYQHFCENDPTRYEMIDASQKVEEIQSQIQQLLEPIIKNIQS